MPCSCSFGALGDCEGSGTGLDLQRIGFQGGGVWFSGSEVWTLYSKGRNFNHYVCLSGLDERGDDMYRRKRILSNLKLCLRYGAGGGNFT